MEALSQAKLKKFAALQQKKYRKQQQLYIVEGKKMVLEALQSEVLVEAIIFLDDFANIGNFLVNEGLPTFVTSKKDFLRLSSQQNPEGVLAIVHAASHSAADISAEKRAILLWNLQDPGNLGTIIRTAEWFGIPQIICSADCVDAHNPKVLRASMGSIFRTNIHYADDFAGLLREQAANIWAADLSGVDVRTQENLGKRPWLLIGNEANGLPEEILSLENLATIRIPGGGSTESLNAAISASILAYALS